MEITLEDGYSWFETRDPEIKIFESRRTRVQERLWRTRFQNYILQIWSGPTSENTISGREPNSIFTLISEECASRWLMNQGYGNMSGANRKIETEV